LNIIVPELNTNDIEQKKYYYKYFPNLDHKLFIKINRPKPPYQSRFEIGKDEVKILNIRNFKINFLNISLFIINKNYSGVTI